MQTIQKLLPLAIAAAGFASVLPSRAERIFGLEANNTLFTFDSATPGTTTTVGVLSGVLINQTIVGIDFRPATKELVAMSFDTANRTGYLYRVNTTTAMLTVIGSGFALPADTTGSDWAFDFNPLVDRIRAVNGTSFRNFRLNPDTGGLAGTDTNVNPGVSLVGAAYSNNVAGATSTTLFVYNATTDHLGTLGGVGGVPSPNGGLFLGVGASGVTASSGQLDLDISGVTGVGYGVLRNIANPGGALYTINTTTGAFTLVGAITGRTVVDLSVDPVVPVVFYQVSAKAPSKEGTVKGAGSFAAGSTVTLKAKAKKGFEFVGWFEGGERISTKAKLTISNLTANRNLKAKFEED